MLMPVGSGGGVAGLGYSNGFATIPTLNIDDLPGGGLSRASVKYTTGSGNHDLISSAANTGGVTIVSHGLVIKTYTGSNTYVSILGQTSGGSVAFDYAWGYNGYPRETLVGCGFPIYLPSGRYVRVSNTGASSAVALAFVTYVTGELAGAVHIDDLQASWGTSYLGAGSSPGGRLILSTLNDYSNGNTTYPHSSGPTAMGEALFPVPYTMFGSYESMYNTSQPAIFLPNGTTRTILAHGFIYVDIP